MKIRSLVGLIYLAMAAAAAPQVTLNNDSIEKMAMAQLGDDVIVAMIQNQAGHYDLDPARNDRCCAKAASRRCGGL